MESGTRRSPPQSPETSDGGAAEAVSDPLFSVSDKDIQEKIERWTSFLSGKGVSSLPDKGKKIRVQIQQLKEEQERRRQHPVRVVDEGSGNCERVSLSKCAESSGSVEHRLANQKVDNDSPSSFAKAFTEKFLQKEGVTTCGDDTRKAGKEKCKSIIKADLKLHGERKENEASKLSMQQQSTVSCRDVQFKSAVLISSEEKSRPAKDCNGASTHLENDTRKAGKEKCKSIIKADLKLHGERKENEASKLSMQQQRTVSCRDEQFKSAVLISSEEKSRPAKDCNGASTHLENNHSSVPAKRKREHDSNNSARSTSKKEVVLLDIDCQTPRENSTEWEEPRVYYPSREHPETVELSPSALNCLEPEQYLSSTVMNFYIMYLQRPGSSTGTATSNCYFFNTYFYNKLEEYASPKGNKRLSFLKLRRWWKGVNLFQKAYIFMPVYGDMHWSLVIICIPPKDDNAGPLVLHLDSLDYHRSISIFNNINKYLKEEWAFIDHNTPDKSEIPITKRIWSNLPRRIENNIVKVPQQENEYDCGLFVLYFMERFVEKAPERLRKKDLSMFGMKWFKTVDASALRHRIRCLLIEVFDKANLENGKPESTSSDGDAPCQESS